MRTGLMIVAAALALSAGARTPAQEPAPPATADAAGGDPIQAAYDAIEADYKREREAYLAAMKTAKSDEERRAISKEKSPDATAYAKRYCALAERKPDHPVAFKCLLWVVRQGRGDVELQRKAVGMLESHVDDPAIADACNAMRFVRLPEAESFLRLVVAKNADHATKGKALYVLGSTLVQLGDAAKKRAGMPAAARDDGDGARKPDPVAAMIRDRDAKSLCEEGERILETVAADYGDVTQFRGSIAEQAKADLYERRNLAIGLVAPEIAGEDVDGKAFKLSDFRGKVVVLDFWGYW